jgi:hypothetical protein
MVHATQEIRGVKSLRGLETRENARVKEFKRAGEMGGCLDG